MDKKSKSIKQALAELFQLVKKESFLDAKAADGSILRTTDDIFKTGSQVVLISEDGTSAPAADGSYTLEDGSVLVIKSGVVDTITPAPAASAAPAIDTTTANPTSDAPAKMEGDVDCEDPDCTDPDYADCSACQDALAADAPAADGSDMGTLVEIIKNLTDRLAALEEKVSSSKMSVEKMSAEPSINNRPKGTVAEYLADYKKEYQAKQKALGERNLKFQQEVHANKRETSLTYSKFNAAPNKIIKKDPIEAKDIFKKF